ncbi:MAG TPA: c-type cytochrome biogenesis protein CcmI [Azonexus sp.]|nr:c-type cytochrome biogenesis protein CcmI [Azonexus sp.]
MPASVPFIVAAILLVAVVLIFLLRPLLRPHGADAVNRKTLNAAIYREQLRELESDRDEGTLTETAFSEAQRELQRRLLAESDGGDAPVAPAPKTSRRTAIALGVILPVAAVGLYAWLGNPDALKPGMGQDHAVNAGNVEDMVATLAARLEKNPDDLRGWAMLARSYKALRRFDDAEKAFARLGDALYTDAGLMASYADLLAVRANGNLEGKPLQLIEKALELEPTNSMALSLAGTAAYDRKDFAGAVRYWERLLKTLPEGSEEAQGVAEALTKIRQENGLAKAPGDGKSAKAGKPAESEKTAKSEKTAPGATISGRIEISKAAAGKFSPTDTLFIFARPVEARMPLAIQRMTVSSLPFDFKLDDSMGLMGGAKLSETPQVVVEARISKSGQATASSGDWFGRSAPVKPGAQGLKIVIDQQVP